MISAKYWFSPQIAILGGLALFTFIFWKGIILEYSSRSDALLRFIESGLECERPNYFQGVTSWGATDTDGDLIPDSWERTYELNYNDPADSVLDPDGDGFTNLQEFQADTDPHSARYNPDVIVVTELGFDCFYTAEMGYFNDDDLLDILIRDPSINYVPAILDFVLIQQIDGSFEIEDAQNYTLNEPLSIQSTLILAELNGDDKKDIALLGLSDFIPSVNDLIVFAPSSGSDLIMRGVDTDVLPFSSKELTLQTTTFFLELNSWINNQDYFEENAAVVATVPEIVDLNWMLDESGNFLSSTQPFSLDVLPDSCNGELVRCYSVSADEGDPFSGSVESSLSISYLQSPYQIQVINEENDPRESDMQFLVRATFAEQEKFNVKDFSMFNQDALSLARNEFQEILESGVMYVPSDEGNVIYRVLGEQLGSRILPLSYSIPEGFSYFYEVEYEHLGEAGILGAIQGVLDFTSRHFVRAPDPIIQ